MIRRFLLVFAPFLVLHTAYTQNWQLFNDTLTYYYQDSGTEEYFTLRLEEKEITETDSTVHFVNNFIPYDEIGIYELYLHDQGSILGESIQYLEDTLVIDEKFLFYPNMSLGDTALFNIYEEREITLSHISDTLLFGIEDSVRYYPISDGTQIILSKNFGIIEYPKQDYALPITYNLVGIEGLVGLSFDYHNTIFDFEEGDEFFYRVGFGNWMDGDTETYWSTEKMIIIDQFIFNGKNYYLIDSYAGILPEELYPRIYSENAPFDHPGEAVIYCRANDLYYDSWMNIMLEDGEKFNSYLGHRYRTSSDGKLVQTIGFAELEEDYETFGNSNISPFIEGLDFQTYEETTLVYPINPDSKTYAIYEEGYGLRYFEWNGLEQIFIKYLIGAIKSGETHGQLAINENEFTEFKIHPNPANETVNIATKLTQIRITGINGQTYILQESGNQINITNLPKGVYILQGMDEFGNFQTGKFIKT